MEITRIGNLGVSRFILGSNPFSGFSHQTTARSEEMLDYYTTANIKAEMRKAEKLGINTLLGRADHHMIRVLREYRNEGGRLQWFAQTCPELGPVERGVQNAIRGRANACYVHGGVMDNYLANNKLDLIVPAIEMIRDAGMPAGIAGHNPEVFLWAEQNLDVDFYMCSYYNPTSRAANPEHVVGAKEWFEPADRERMIDVIRGLSRPVIHYKVLAAGRNDPKEAFERVARAMRPSDAVCVGIYAGDDIAMLEKDVRLFHDALAAYGQAR